MIFGIASLIILITGQNDSCTIAYYSPWFVTCSFLNPWFIKMFKASATIFHEFVPGENTIVSRNRLCIETAPVKPPKLGKNMPENLFTYLLKINYLFRSTLTVQREKRYCCISIKHSPVLLFGYICYLHQNPI